ncbi:MAG: purine-nucleoside phosphorylase [Candidatus Treponema excrementipullorum]|nr:purine-nucleoside phosphorylase [Spirochaetia bacterium]MDD7012982.1 purine-nucleoside phosphorylase [Candidatus Treponema excrementipullorum]MCI6953676.1 purine-nucleoside phosphorylase [Spirochaetia bacterium]MCI7589496.1 purine-nucleoside phosphorylase [Spirochaetia bacterium]MDY2756885.1 purine-nucleoside phosphorylase [Candidatus Treponema excrementipullorum]
MSTHINAKEGQIADTILLPGDPLRAKFIAENFLENAECYNEVRGMYGFTGTYKGKRVSVQGTGMGQPSLSIYVNELFQFYGVQKAIRVGTCGAIHESTKVRDTILATSACTDSSLMLQRFGNLHYAPTANFELLMAAYKAAQEAGIKTLQGPVASSDLFYDENANWKTWAKYGVLGVEMEAAELYTLAAKFNRKALAIITVSDHIVTGEATTAEERQTTFSNMIKLALEAGTSC